MTEPVGGSDDAGEFAVGAAGGVGELFDATGAASPSPPPMYPIEESPVLDEMGGIMLPDVSEEPAMPAPANELNEAPDEPPPEASGAANSGAESREKPGVASCSLAPKDQGSKEFDSAAWRRAKELANG